ncbi:carbohydrate sulfotransferase 9-like [Ruditapes philippinarum]|uniref:carbohydrate sulfotransferase 9-like n=1 Tax=Ruditapes philippinarum TaxID=129788 RepID=UPI00295B2AED|nr:carbohydrate sulfotransferase 9-like [Ruditapes philippinarum]
MRQCDDENAITLWQQCDYAIILAENNNKQVFGKPTIYPTDGYERAAYLRKTSYSSIINDVRLRIRAHYDETHHVFYCPLCKIASTFWSRVFKMFEYKETTFVEMHPYEINISDVLNSELYFSTSRGEILRSNGIWSKINVQDSFKFLFVRNPYDVLFSAFVDKIVGPNPYYWNVFKTELDYKKTDVSIKLCGADLKFGQFLQNVVKRFLATNTLDCHVNTLDACQPCTMNYTFVGKMETLKEDTFHILSMLNQSRTLEMFENQFSSLYADDAIKDSTSGPFKWKDEIVECIPWVEALQRI